MNRSRTRARRCFIGLLIILVGGGLGLAQTSSKGNKELLPGAKLVGKYPAEVYRVPAIFVTDKGLRLLVWSDESDPNPKPPFPGAPIPLRLARSPK